MGRASEYGMAPRSSRSEKHIVNMGLSKMREFISSVQKIRCDAILVVVDGRRLGFK